MIKLIKSCIRAPVLLNLLNSMGKTDKMLGKASHLMFSPTCSINSIIHKHSCKILYIITVIQSWNQVLILNDFSSVAFITVAHGQLQ